MRRRRFPTPKSRGDLPGRAPAGAGKFPFVLEGSGARPASPGRQALRKCTLLAGKSLQPTPNFAKILLLSEPSLKLPTLGLQSLGRGRDGRGASLSRLLPPWPHLRSKPAWSSNREAGKQRPSSATRARALSWTEFFRGLPCSPFKLASPGGWDGFLSWCPLSRHPNGARAGWARGRQGCAASYLKKSFLQ